MMRELDLTMEEIGHRVDRIEEHLDEIAADVNAIISVVNDKRGED